MCHPRRGRIRASSRTVRKDHAKKHTRLRGATAQVVRRQVQFGRHRKEIVLLSFFLSFISLLLFPSFISFFASSTTTQRQYIYIYNLLNFFILVLFLIIYIMFIIITAEKKRKIKQKKLSFLYF